MSQRTFDRAARQRQEKAQRRNVGRAGLAAGVVGATALLAPAAANAATFQVDKLTDGAPGGACDAGTANDCSLRDAIALANANPDSDTITFGVTGEITFDAGQGQLNISNPVSIQGPGRSALTVSANNHSRVFNITGTGPVSISGLTIADGDGTQSAGDADSKDVGGAIYTSVDTTLTDSVVTGSSGTRGGGIYHTNEQDLELVNSKVTENESNTDGAGIWGAGATTLTNSVVSGNTANDGDGGGIYQDKYDLTLTDSTVSDNSAVNGGGIQDYAGASSDSTTPKYDMTIVRSTISDNDAAPDGGVGGGINFEHRINSTNLISDSTIANNSATIGGGIHAGQDVEVPSSTTKAAGSGTLNVNNTTIAANTATSTGGGIGLEDNSTNGGGVGLSSTIVGDNTAASANKDISTSNEGLTSVYGLVEVPGSASITTVAAKPTITGKDPQLGSLADNGGPTLTKLPATTSPAIDQGTANSLSIDQRHLARTVNLGPANASDGTDIGAVEVPATPPTPVTPSATTQCGRRAISLVRADLKGSKVKLTGLVGSKLYGKTVTIQTDPKGAKTSGFTKTTTVKSSAKTGSFTVSVPRPSADDLVTVRYRAKAGGATSPALKIPQSLTSHSVKSAKGTITVKGHVKKSVLGKRNRVKIRRLVCGRYRTVGSARPDEDGNYTVTFKSTALRGVSFYRAESHVLRKPGSKHYVIQYARAIAIRTTSQTG
jgi:CSLREA domain-containing protein